MRYITARFIFIYQRTEEGRYQRNLPVWRLKKRANSTEEVLKAEPLKEEPDRASVKWPKKKKRIVYKRKTTPSRKNLHPGTRQARRALSMHARALATCQNCGKSNVTVAVHHIDCNPYNNSIDNLLVLCPSCHMKTHSLQPELVDEANEIPCEFDPPSLDIDETNPDSSILIQQDEMPGHVLKQLGADSSKKICSSIPRRFVKSQTLRASQYYGLQCRLCIFYRAFKNRCEQKNKETTALQLACECFEYS